MAVIKVDLEDYINFTIVSKVEQYIDRVILSTISRQNKELYGFSFSFCIDFDCIDSELTNKEMTILQKRYTLAGWHNVKVEPKQIKFESLPF